MSFPDDAPDVRIEAALGADLSADPASWVWTDITETVDIVVDGDEIVVDGDDVVWAPGRYSRLLSQELQIRRGRADESSRTQPASVSVVLDNPDGDVTPKNPASLWFPHWKRGVPLRLRVMDVPTSTTVAAIAPGTTGADQLSTPDASQLDITGGCDLRFDGELNWGVLGDLLHKKTLTAGYSFSVVSDDDGRPCLSLAWRAPYEAAPVRSDPIPFGTGRRTYRAVLDMTSETVRFYVASTIDGPWVALGGARASGSTGITANAVPLLAGPWARKVYAAQVRDGSGVLVADLDMSAVTPAASSFVDSTGLTWTLAGDMTAETVTAGPVTRLIGQVGDLSLSWPYGDIESAVSPGESRVTVTAAGVLRRLGQRQKPLDSALRQWTLHGREQWGIGNWPLLGYWPAEQGGDSRRIASAIPGVRPGTVTGWGTTTDSTLPSSGPLPTFGSDGGAWSVAPTGEANRAVVVFKLDQATDEATVLRVQCGPLVWWVWTNSGLLWMSAVVNDDDSGSLGSVSVPINGPLNEWTAVVIDVSPWVAYATAHACSFRSGGWTSSTGLGPDPQFEVPYIQRIEGGPCPGMSMGHIMALGAGSNIDVGFLDVAFRAHHGEPAAVRLTRLADEQGVPVEMSGLATTSTPMGWQTLGTFLDLIQECVDADGGMLGEMRDGLGLTYRTRESLYNQPALTLDATAGEIAIPFEPVEDDQRIRNDVTVTRAEGSFSRVTDVTSINRDGLVDEEVTLNLAYDDQTIQQAGWRLHLGTWDGLRYPTITVDLMVAPQLIPAVTALIEGDRIEVTNLPSQHPGSSVSLLVEGITESISPSRWTFEFACSPAAPWTIGKIAPDTGDSEYPDRLDTAGSELDEDIGASATSFDIATTDGPVWIYDGHADYEVPFDITIGGEVMTVTAITGATSPQTFTVTRAVNAISKAHTAGAPVALAEPIVLAL